MRKTLIAMLGLVAIGMWAFPAIAGVTSGPPPAKEYQPFDGRSGPVGASAAGGNSRLTLSGTTLKASAVDVTQWYLYPGACKDKTNGAAPGVGTWAPKNTPPIADSLDAAGQLGGNAAYTVGSQGFYSRVDLSLKESLWNTATGPAGGSATTPPIPGGSGGHTLWCGKYDPNFVVKVGYPNQTFQIMYIDTGAHSANYTLTFLMNQSTEYFYDYVDLIGGGNDDVDPLHNSRARFDEALSSGTSGNAKVLVEWTGSIRSTTPGATSINTVGVIGRVTIAGSATLQPDATVATTVTIAAANRALYVIMRIDCGYSSQDGLWPLGHGVMWDEVSVSDNFPGSPNFGVGGLYHDQAQSFGVDSGVTPPTSLAITGTFALLGTGCVVRAQGHVGAPVAFVEVEDDPPPPRVLVVETRPGFIWIEGRWARAGGQWVWRDGYYERERVGYYYDQGRWEPRGRGHVWVEGQWRGGGNGNGNNGKHEGEVRDHRSGRPQGPPPQQGPVVRDHRTH